MTRRLHWAEYRTAEFQNLDPETTLAVLPTAAIEQHGPHLPVGTDTMIASGMIDELCTACPDDLDLRILPVQAVGKSNEHLFAQGTVTFDAETALRAWLEIGLSVARAGLRKIVIVNSHGGNLDLISILTRELRVRADMLAVKCQWGSFGHPEGLFSDHELTFGIHGGDVETSLMLAFQPHTVDMTKAENFISSAETANVKPVGLVSRGWIATDVNPNGVVGNAAAATAKKGRDVALHQVNGLIGLLRDVRDMPLPPKNSSGFQGL
ncbi:MAG: creatininase family protein [Pseudomonadota bacterium]